MTEEGSLAASPDQHCVGKNVSWRNYEQPPIPRGLTLSWARPTAWRSRLSRKVPAQSRSVRCTVTVVAACRPPSFRFWVVRFLSLQRESRRMLSPASSSMFFCELVREFIPRGGCCARWPMDGTHGARPIHRSERPRAARLWAWREATLRLWEAPPGAKRVFFVRRILYVCFKTCPRRSPGNFFVLHLSFAPKTHMH